MSEETTPLRATDHSGTPVRAALAVVTAAVPAALACLAIAAVAHAAGASSEFQALQPTAFVPFLVLGTVAGAVGWLLIRRRAEDPRRLLTRLVPTVLVLSWIPDLLVGLTRALPGSGPGGAAALMAMHAVVTACAVASFLRFLPIEGSRLPLQGRR